MPIKKTFTLIELLVVISIISVLASLLLPSLRRAKESAQQVTCVNNQKQIGYACYYYTDDNNGYWPNGNPWAGGAWAKMIAFDGEYLDSGVRSYLLTPELACASNSIIDSDWLNYYAPVMQFDVSFAGQETLWGSRSQVGVFKRLSKAKSPSETATLLEWGAEALPGDPVGAGGQYQDWEGYLRPIADYASSRRSSGGYRGGMMVYDDVHNGSSNLIYADNHVKKTLVDDFEYTAFRLTQ